MTTNTLVCFKTIRLKCLVKISENFIIFLSNLWLVLHYIQGFVVKIVGSTDAQIATNAA